MSEPEFPVYEPNRLPADRETARPPQVAAPGHLVAQARDVQVRTESYGVDRGTLTVLSFRVDDGRGGLVEVDLRGMSLTGSVRDGDWVQVADQRGRSGGIEVDRLANLTTRTEVSMIGSPRSAGAKAVRTVAIVIFVVALLFIVGVGVAVFTAFQSFGP